MHETTILELLAMHREVIEAMKEAEVYRKANVSQIKKNELYKRSLQHKRDVITDIRRCMQDCEHETADVIRTRMAEILDKR